MRIIKRFDKFDSKEVKIHAMHSFFAGLAIDYMVSKSKAFLNHYIFHDETKLIYCISIKDINVILCLHECNENEFIYY